MEINYDFIATFERFHIKDHSKRYNFKIHSLYYVNAIYGFEGVIFVAQLAAELTVTFEHSIFRKLRKRGVRSTEIARKSAQRWRFETNDYMTGNYGASDRVWAHATLREYKGETLVERGPDSFGHEAIGFSSLRFSFTFVSTMWFSLERQILKLV